ncbi:MAG TPA: ABC-2 family transporter protein [Terrimicrobiaceae bacterium]
MTSEKFLLVCYRRFLITLMPIKYWSVFTTGLQNTFVYRWNFLLRSIFAIVPLIGTVFIWKALFESRGEDIRGYDFGQMIYYFLAVLLIDNLVTPTDDEWQIAAEIREGQINNFLSKPIDYLAYRASLFLSARLLYTAITILPVIAVFAWFHEFIVLPKDPVTWSLFAISLVMAAAIQFLIAYALAMLAFWILEISTVVFILYSFEYYLSGRLFPLNVMPDWMQTILMFLPFTYELYFPVAILLEKVRGVELWGGLAIQSAWVALSFAAARWMWRAGLRRYESVGG